MTHLEAVTRIHAPIDRCFQLSLSVEVHVRGNTHFSEQTVALNRSRPGGQPGTPQDPMGLGDTVTWQARHFWVTQRLTSRITRYDRPHAFQDTMLRGAFASMQHDHLFCTLPNGATEMRDHFRFAAPLGPLGLLAERLVLARYMRALLTERNAAIKQVAESEDWKLYLSHGFYKTAV